MEAIPELRMETEDRQSTAYEVHHQKLVKTRAAETKAVQGNRIKGSASPLSPRDKRSRLSPWRRVPEEAAATIHASHLVLVSESCCPPIAAKGFFFFFFRLVVVLDANLLL